MWRPKINLRCGRPPHAKRGEYSPYNLSWTKNWKTIYFEKYDPTYDTISRKWGSFKVGFLGHNGPCCEYRPLESNFPSVASMLKDSVSPTNDKTYSASLAGEHGTAKLHHKMRATATEPNHHFKAFKPCTLKRRRSDFANPIAWHRQCMKQNKQMRIQVPTRSNSWTQAPPPPCR